MTDDKPKRRRTTKAKRTTKPKRSAIVFDSPSDERSDDEPTNPEIPTSLEPAGDHGFTSESVDSSVQPPLKRKSKPGRTTIEKANLLSRDAVCEAVYAAAFDRGDTSREALAAAEDIADRLRLDGDVSTRDAKGFYDLREEQDYTYPGGKNKVRTRGTSPVMRDPSTVTTIVVHQTAVEFGVSKRLIKASGGDIELARARRALDVACHAMAFRQGYFVAAHPLRAYVNHGNRFNATSLGLEIDGRYPGIMDDPATVAREDLRTTWGGEPTELTEETIATACNAIGWLVEEGRREGMPIESIASHRQSSDARRSDPGQEIWQRAVLEAASMFRLNVLRDSPWTQGRPIPTQWDPDGIGSY